MNRINYFKYNPLYSFFCYLKIKRDKRILFLTKNIGREVTFPHSGTYRIFQEMAIQNKDMSIKKGKAQFRISFHSPRVAVDSIIKRTKHTFPFFSGLPGFCNKQFMVNEKDKTFSGRYEWETVEMAQNYARSFAVEFMRRRSSPLPIYYEIIDMIDNKIVESGEC